MKTYMNYKTCTAAISEPNPFKMILKPQTRNDRKLEYQQPTISCSNHAETSYLENSKI